MCARYLTIVMLLGAVPLCRGQQSNLPPVSKTTTPGGATGSTSQSGLPGTTTTTPGGKGTTTSSAFQSGSTGTTTTQGSARTTTSGATMAPTGAVDDLLSLALKSNPDIQLAESKVREAEAELNR